MPESDVTKMKVADLKRELKLRGLSTTGNKNELQDRLQTALLDGDISLDDTAISDVLEEDVGVLTDEDEDKLLVDENELLKSPITTPTNELLQISPEVNANASVATSSTKQNVTTPAPTKKIILKRESSQNASASVAVNTFKENDTPKDETSPNGIVHKHPPIVISNSSSAASADNTEKKVTQLSAKERLELRAKRFGVQANVTPSGEEADKSSKSNKYSKASILANNGNKETDEMQMQALKRRAERFGCVTSSKLAKIDASEKLAKRKERFGLADGNTTTTTTTNSANTTKVPTGTTTSSSSGTDIWAEKARARLERFKVPSPTTTTLTTASTVTADESATTAITTN